MNLIELAKQHVQQITGNAGSGFGVSIKFTAPTGETFTANGLHTRISHDVQFVSNKEVSGDGRKSHASMAEQRFIDNAYPYRNSATGEINLRGHFVEAPDALGVLQKYQVKTFYPDETLGLIVCTLNDCE